MIPIRNRSFVSRPLEDVLADNMSACDRRLTDLDIHWRHTPIRIDLRWGRPELARGQIQQVDIRQKDDLMEEER